MDILLRFAIALAVFGIYGWLRWWRSEDGWLRMQHPPTPRDCAVDWAAWLFLAFSATKAVADGLEFLAAPYELVAAAYIIGVATAAVKTWYAWADIRAFSDKVLAPASEAERVIDAKEFLGEN